MTFGRFENGGEALRFENPEGLSGFVHGFVVGLREVGGQKLVPAAVERVLGIGEIEQGPHGRVGVEQATRDDGAPQLLSPAFCGGQ
ncbi:MAG: hypothetical protein AB9869_32995 [Verrucomicrobiia bacterium]